MFANFFKFLDPDSNFNFFFKKAKSCVENLQILNPLVKVHADCDPIETKESSFFSKDNFDLVCYLLHNNFEQLVYVNEACRQNSVSFISGYVFGIHGYMFVDLNNYKFIWFVLINFFKLFSLIFAIYSVKLRKCLMTSLRILLMKS